MGDSVLGKVNKMQTTNQSLGQSPRDMQDNIAGKPNATQASLNGSQCNGSEQQPNVAPAAAPGANWGNIPAELRARTQWCMAAADKKPLTATGALASSTNPSTWGDFDTVTKAAAARGLHIGYVLSADDPYTCIDMDVKSATTQEDRGRFDLVVKEFDSYTEHSRSGKGLHVWVKGAIGKGRRDHLEVYSQERFIISTGNVVQNKPIENRQDLLNTLISEINAEKESAQPLPDRPEVESDELILERASSAANRDKFKAHFNANWDAIGHLDKSKADMALLQMLALYTPNNEQLTRLFLKSSLGQREKATQRKNYLPGTIKKVRSIQAVEHGRREHGRQLAEPLVLNFKKKQAEKAAEKRAHAESRIKVYSAKNYSQRPPARWRVRGVLPEQGFAVIYGPSGSGKSFLALDMLAHIAAGRDWFGHRVHKAPVAYLALEGTAGVPQRIKAFQSKHWDMEDVSIMVDPTMNLTNPADQEALIGTLKKHSLLNGVLCIDTLAASAAGIDENSSEGMGKLIANLQEIQYEIGGCVLVIHHTGKDEARGMRGWSGLKGALDGAIEVVRPKNNDNRSWNIAKSKDGEDGLTKRFNLESVLIEYDEYGEPVSSCVIAPAGSATKVDHSELANDNDDDDFVWSWVKAEVEAGNFPSKNSLKNQLSDMKPKRDITQKRVAGAIERLMAASRLAIDPNKSPSGNQWIRAVES